MGLIPWLHSTSGMLQNTAYLLLGHMAANQGIHDISDEYKVIFMAGLTILKKERCLGRLCGRGADREVALHLRNAADYRLPTFGPHGTKLGNS